LRVTRTDIVLVPELRSPTALPAMAPASLRSERCPLANLPIAARVTARREHVGS
jgi:hypothetical protein